jgi:hypothetical protein
MRPTEARSAPQRTVGLQYRAVPMGYSHSTKERASTFSHTRSAPSTESTAGAASAAPWICHRRSSLSPKAKPHPAREPKK